MQFKNYFFRLGTQERKNFAEKVGTSSGHLTNFCYGYTTLAPKVCVAIERESTSAVTRQELMPGDWQEIWPELAHMVSKATRSKNRRSEGKPVNPTPTSSLIS